MLVLLSSVSFTFGMHFCMGQLQSFALFSGAEPCEMTQEEAPCTSDKHDPDRDYLITKKGCCEDHTVVVEGSEDLSIVSSISAPDLQLAAVLYALVSFIFSAPQLDFYSFKDYSPPLIDRDIPVLVQSFLI